MNDGFALLDDCNACDPLANDGNAQTASASGVSRLYTGFVREHRCDDPDTLEVVWAHAEADQRAGLHLVVLADYEWGARLMQAGHERLKPEQGGSLRFLVFDSLRKLSADAVEHWLRAREAAECGSANSVTPLPAGVLNWRPTIDRGAFHDAIASIHAAIREGETYQVNYTYRVDFDAFGHPLSLYRRLRARQPVSYGALIAVPGTAGQRTWILSCSPELFLRHAGGTLTAKPMKGTASRAKEPEGDSEIARMLSEDVKNRAENLMIVDLLRNDLGRVARTGSVRVPALFSVEAYPTVFQMTSTITASLPTTTAFPDLMRALFPCGSITGAPKHRTMQLIAALENTPRGLYTGSIGWIDPPAEDASCGDFCLSVAIRTLSLEAGEGGLHRGRIGVGAGIVIDSRAEEEYEECLLKARFLTGLDPGFSLFESLYANRTDGVRNLDLHLARLGASAAELAFHFPRESIVAALQSEVRRLPAQGAFRMRLTLHKSGRFELVVAPLEALSKLPVRLLLARAPADAPHGLLRHKTTLRHVYDEAIRQAQEQGAFDMLFFDADGYLTEGGRSNVFLHVDGQWRTPPLGPHVLPGTMRAVLVADPAWNVHETTLTRADLHRADRIVVTNALRGVLDAVVTEVSEAGA